MNNHQFLTTNNEPPFLSVLVPVHNEAENIEPLIAEIYAALEGNIPYEVIYVDDGSTDNSWSILQELANRFKRLRIIRHRRSYGQSIAILTGVKAARAQWIAMLDGDGQNDPTDITSLLAILQSPARPPNLQMVAGYRQKRQDNWLKRLSSKIANGIRRRFLHDNTPDTGCGLKLFSRHAFLAIPQFNHNHRFLPALFLRNGGQIISVAISHRPRAYGQSNYGLIDRLGTGIIDLLGVMWLQRRSSVADVIEDNLKPEE
jgi:dolichol-phosphate mannosyltransferase